MTEQLVPIPGPRALPVIGNILDIDQTKPVQRFMELAKEHGPIFEIKFPGGRHAVFLSSQELVAEVCGEHHSRQ